MRLFGQARESAWRQLSTEIGAEYVPGSLTRSSRVIKPYGNWRVKLGLHTQSYGETSQTFTRVRGPFVARDPLHLALSRRNLLKNIGSKLGMADAPIGDPDFDSAFVVRCKDTSRAAALFAGDHICKLVDAHRSASLRINATPVRSDVDYEEGVNEVVFMVQGTIRDIERLKQMVMLIETVLVRLCEIGVAYDFDPTKPYTIPAADILVRGSMAPLTGEMMLRAAYGPGSTSEDELLRGSDSSIET